jgi:hypothetical protein
MKFAELFRDEAEEAHKREVSERQRLRLSPSGANEIRMALVVRQRQAGAPHLAVLAKETHIALHLLEAYAKSDASRLSNDNMQKVVKELHRKDVYCDEERDLLVGPVVEAKPVSTIEHLSYQPRNATEQSIADLYKKIGEQRERERAAQAKAHRRSQEHAETSRLGLTRR